MAGDSLDGKDSRDGEAYVRLRSASEDEQRKEMKREKIVRRTTTVNSHREVQRYYRYQFECMVIWRAARDRAFVTDEDDLEDGRELG